MISDYIKVSGFDFVKVGEFRFSEKPYQFKNWTSDLMLNLCDPIYEKADETTYLLIIDEKIMYVGEFTYNLKSRWISKNHVNHHMYDNIEKSLQEEKVISLWLAISPYYKIPDCGEELNVSKALEQHIMRKEQPPWNLRNKQSEAKEWREKNCIRLDSLILKT